MMTSGVDGCLIFLKVFEIITITKAEYIHRYFGRGSVGASKSDTCGRSLATAGNDNCIQLTAVVGGANVAVDDSVPPAL